MRSAHLEYTKAKLFWLESILSQRLTSELSLQISSDSIFITIADSNKQIEIESSLGCFKSDSTRVPCLEWDYDRGTWNSLIENFLPAPGYSNLEFQLITETDSGYKIKYDILGLVYWMLSRQEEVGRTDLDQWGRFPATSSHAFKHNYLERPIVDEWLDVLKQVMQLAWPNLKFNKYRFQLKVSHDVDLPSRYIFQNTFGVLRRMAGDVLKRGNIYDAMSAPWSRLKDHEMLPKNDPINTFSWLMDQSEKHNLKSAFYFICGKTHPQTDADYEIEHPAIRSLMRNIHKRGHEIGLHPSYNTCHTPEAIVSEAKRLKGICVEEGIRQQQWGGRMHFLRWNHPITLYGWEEADMAYDSTLSYADHAGFRCGTCFEYPAFDPVADKQLNLRIRPLVAMDVTINGYMGLGFGQAAYDKLTELKNACRAVNGTFTLLWHNNQLETKQARDLYSSLLE
jgi:hypothetical protein